MKGIYSTENMFYNITNLILLEINEHLTNHSIIIMKNMFKNCINLKTLIFVNNDFKYVQDLSYMFDNCFSLSSLILPIFSYNKLENMSYMFANCTSLKSVEFPFINTSNVKNMEGLFYGCYSLISINLSSFDTRNVVNINYMFAGCSSISSINLECFELEKIEDLNYIFLNCSNLNFVKLPSLNEKQNKILNNMFIGCKNLSIANIQSKPVKNKKINDVCIVGPWYGRNYGSMLTYYALHEVVKDMGYSILMIDDPLETKKMIYNKNHPKNMTSYLYNISQKRNLDNLSELNSECRCFLTGSDQLWNIYLSRPLKQFYFLGFVDNNRKKLSYATSFGIQYSGTEEEKKITKINLERFDGISVRDEISLNVSKDTFGIKNVIQVCDPTFLCDFSYYLKLAEKIKIQNIEEEFILAYILDPNYQIGNGLEKLSIDRKIKIIIILDFPPDLWDKNRAKLALKGKGNIELKNTVNINEWLWLYNNSKAVFTDSFHGTIFSIIFQKPFITLRNTWRGGERFFSLLRPLKLTHRLFETPDCINKNYELLERLNYTIPLEILKKIKEESYNWLKKKLNLLLT